MGLTYCKSLFTKSKTQHSVNNENGVKIYDSPAARSHPATASDYHVSTIQDAVVSKENRRSTISAATATTSRESSHQATTRNSHQFSHEKDDKYLESVVCKESELGENEMKEVGMGDDKKVLLIKQHGKFFAIGANCAHYGLPLITGALGEGRVRCPWHGACFNIETGDMEDFPGLDSVPCFEVNVDQGLVKVRARKSDLETDQRVKSMALKNGRKDEIFVIVGGGPSAHTCAETLRQNAFNGRILMICKEFLLPYDRVKISKYLNMMPEEVQLRTKEFYDENHIEVMLNVEATSLNSNLKELSLSSGSQLKYDKVFIATGSRAKRPSIPGNDLNNIFTLRDIDDANEIDRKLSPSSHIVILGSSFIALEVAAYCVDKVSKVTIIGRSSVPLMESFGEAIGGRIMKLFESKNIDFIMNNGVASFLAINQEYNLSAVKLLDDTILKADVCVVGIGSELNTDFLLDSGLTINKNGSIDTNQYLQTNVANVFVGGDIANSPIFISNNELATIGHYAVAQHHGKVAALNMIGTKTELKVVPYFFTFLFGHCFTYTGHGKASEISIEGDLDSLKFVAFYFDDNENVIAMSSCQPDKRTAEFAEKLAQGKRFTRKDLKDLIGVVNEPPAPLVTAIEPSTDYIYKTVCHESDLEDNNMTEVDMGNDKKVLLIKQNGKLSAIGANCAHYGAPLVTGALGEGRVRCPWHGACFNIETGDIEDFPGLDSVPCFEVNVDQGLVKIRARKSDLETDQRVKSMDLKNGRNGEIFVIVGGGPSAQTCAETLRQNAFNGRILMICKEDFLPYDRVKISKYLNSKLEDVQLRSKEFYDENHIEVTLNAAATSLNTNLKELSLSCGNKLKYDKLYIATGSRAKQFVIPGRDLENIFTLRTLDDAHKIDAMLSPTKHVVILGSSFIGLEAASYCAGKVEKVTIIGSSSMPLIDQFGEAIGNRIMQLFKSKNVDFIMNSSIKRFLGNYKDLERIELNDGTILWADICIVGIGSELNTNFLHDSGLAINKNGSIDTNQYLQTNVVDVFVGGDIANSPIFINNNELATIGHYSLAQHHGKVAALNMIGLQTELRTVPYFSTLLFDSVFTYTGHGRPAEIFIEGDLEALKFVAFYFDEKEIVIGMSSCQPDKSIAEFAEKLAQGYQFHKNDIEWISDNEQ